jgi:membrane-bound inhibitor of C-type lysozyme
MKKIEQIAALLIKLKVSFNYSPTFLEVKSGEKLQPFNVTYHCENRRLNIMDVNHKELTFEDIFENYLKAKK